MLLSAIAALFLVSFGLGVFWRPSQRQNIFLYGYTTVIKSFYLAWFVFLISYNSSFGESLPLLSILGAGAAIVVFAKLVNDGVITQPVGLFAAKSRVPMAIALLVVFGATIMAASQPMGNIFTAWDALASWNRWAAELSANKYNPLNSAYPILMPALWSLIYEAQSSTEIWFFARAVLSFVPLAVMALAAYAGLKKGLIAFIALAAPLLFGFVLTEPLYSGYMDRPSALLAVGGLLAAVLALDEADETRRNELLTISVMTVVLAVLTKQHAVFAAFAVCSLVAILTFKRRVSFVRAAALAAIFLIPVVSFLLIYLEQRETLWGNLAALNAVSERTVGGQSKITFALETMGAELPRWVWALMVAGTLSNLFFFRRPQAIFALGVAALTVPGFFIYADCCSYSERNGIWILGHLSVSTFVGVSMLVAHVLKDRPSIRSIVGSPVNGLSETRPISPHALRISGFLVMFTMVLFFIEWPTERILERQQNQQRYRIVPRIQAMINRQPNIFAFADTVVTPVQLLKYHPDIPKPLRYCQPAKLTCFQNIPAEKTLYITAPWFENEASTALIDQLVRDGTLRLLDEERGTSAYQVVKLPEIPE